MALLFLPIPFFIGFALREQRRALAGAATAWLAGATAFVVLAATGENVGALIWVLIALMLPVFLGLAWLGSRVRQRRAQ